MTIVPMARVNGIVNKKLSPLGARIYANALLTVMAAIRNPANTNNNQVRYFIPNPPRTRKQGGGI